MAAPTMKLTLRVLAHLLRYPDAALREHLAELLAALDAEAALVPPRRAELAALIERLGRLDPLRVEAEYVEMFDRGRRTALNLFEHVHGDSRDRGPAMIDLAQSYERAGLLLAPGELPDALPVVLEFASTQPAAQAREFLRETAHIVRMIFSALQQRRSPYAAVLAAVLDLAGEKAEPVRIRSGGPDATGEESGHWPDAAGRAERVELPEEPALDDEWAEPEAFGGCSTQGQAKPGEAQPIHLHRSRPARDAGFTTGAAR